MSLLSGLSSDRAVWARKALLPEGWLSNVRVAISDAGLITSVEAGVDKPLDKDYQVGILLPAPVNVHSHSFQRAMAGLTESRSAGDATDNFWTWRQLMYRFLDKMNPDHIEAVAAFVQMQMLESGYACNVEFHYLHHQPDGSAYTDLSELSQRIIAAADQSGIGLTLLPVHYQFGGCDERPLQGGQKRFGNDLDRYQKLYQSAQKGLQHLPADAGIGVAPHSLRAISSDHISQYCVIANGAPVHMHIAEQVSEVLEVEESFGRRPVDWLLNNTDINQQWCLIHCTQMTPAETTKLAKSGAVAGLCPITEANLGDGIFNGVHYLKDGGAIAIGSDSNVRISLSEELRALEYSQRLRDHSRAALADTRHSCGRRLFDSMLSGGAQAAGRKSGEIASGLWADMLSLDDSHVDLAGRTGDTIIDCFVFASDDRVITDVWSAGRHLVREGMHTQRTSITEKYAAVVSELGAII